MKKILRKNIGKDSTAAFLHLAINHSQISYSNKIVEDVNLFNVVAWNLALICLQSKEDQSIVNSYLKKLQLNSKTEELIHERVKNWISYYNFDISEALENSKILLKKCKDIEYLYSDVSKDIEIFKKELNLN